LALRRVVTALPRDRLWASLVLLLIIATVVVSESISAKVRHAII
jgi:ABC-type phosphate/phosphonate transport system permease subunit